MKNQTQVLKNFSKKQKVFGIVKMGLDQIIPAIFLIAVLILILPGFLNSNSNSNQFFKNLSIWSIIVVSLVIVSYLIFK